MNKFTLMGLYKTRLSIYLVLSLLCVLASDFVFKQIPVSSEDYLPKITYYSGDRSEELAKILDAQGIEYGYTMPKYLSQTEFDENKFKLTSELDQKINLHEVKYLNNSSDGLAEANNGALLEGNGEQDFGVSVMLYPKFIGGQNVSLESGPGELSFGVLPQNEKEVVVPENYALSLIAKDTKLNSYEQLLGQKVTLSKEGLKKEMIISGIAINNQFYVLPSEEQVKRLIDSDASLKNSLFINFKSLKERMQFIRNYDFKLQVDTIWNQKNLVPLMSVLVKLICLLLMNIVLLRYVWKVASKLNVNQKGLSNYLYPWVIPGLIINGIYLVLWI